MYILKLSLIFFHPQDYSRACFTMRAFFIYMLHNSIAYAKCVCGLAWNLDLLNFNPHSDDKRSARCCSPRPQLNLRLAGPHIALKRGACLPLTLRQSCGSTSPVVRYVVSTGASGVNPCRRTLIRLTTGCARRRPGRVSAVNTSSAQACSVNHAVDDVSPRAGR